MHEHGYDIQSAVEWMSLYHSEHRHAFMTVYEGLPQWSADTGPMANDYVEGLANWVRAHVCWIFKCGRYFGDEGMKVKDHRTVRLLPRVSSV